MWFVDCYRCDDGLVLWLKEKDKNIRHTIPYQSTIFIQASTKAKQTLDQRNLRYKKTVHKTPLGQQVNVFAVAVPDIGRYERIVEDLERATLHRVPLFNADIAPEQHFMYLNKLCCGCEVEITNGTIVSVGKQTLTLTKALLRVETKRALRNHPNEPINRIFFDGQQFRGSEERVLRRFAEAFAKADPDVLVAADAFLTVPHLDKRLRKYGISCALHRWDAYPLRYRGGKAFHSYGRTVFRDFGVRLNGRFLVSSHAAMSEECDVDGVLELCELSGVRFQQVASRSHGAVFQGALVGEMLRSGVVVPHKQKPLPQPIDLASLVKADRAGHTFDADVGFHRDVVEIDFSCLFPALMVQENISAEKLDAVGKQAPGVPVWIGHDSKGFVARTLERFVERRYHHKKFPTAVNRKRSAALKGVLVSANGYLRFREFKLGLASTHVALCAYARECILTAKGLAEERGFRLVHGIVDSLYLQKPGMSDRDVELLCKDIEQVTGVAIDIEGFFRWVVFLPSVNNPRRPVPTRYFGSLRQGGVKIRGIEARQRSPPGFIKRFQEEFLSWLEDCSSREEFLAQLPRVCSFARGLLARLDEVPKEQLAGRVTLTKERYKVDNLQSKVLARIRENGLPLIVGRGVRYVLEERGPVLLHEYSGSPCKDSYKELLIRCIHSVFAGVGVSKQQVQVLFADERQLKISHFLKNHPMITSLHR